MDRDLSSGKRYPPCEKLGLERILKMASYDLNDNSLELENVVNTYIGS